MGTVRCQACVATRRLWCAGQRGPRWPRMPPRLHAHIKRVRSGCMLVRMYCINAIGLATNHPKTSRGLQNIFKVWALHIQLVEKMCTEEPCKTQTHFEARKRFGSLVFASSEHQHDGLCSERCRNTSTHDCTACSYRLHLQGDSATTNGGPRLCSAIASNMQEQQVWQRPQSTHLETTCPAQHSLERATFLARP